MMGSGDPIRLCGVTMKVVTPHFYWKNHLKTGLYLLDIRILNSFSTNVSKKMSFCSQVLKMVLRQWGNIDNFILFFKVKELF